MTDDWTEIHPDFTEELVEDGKGFGFDDYEQIEEGINVRGFSPGDAEFASYIGDEGLIINELENPELVRLRKKYNEAVKKIDVVKKDSLKRKFEKVEITDSNDKSGKNIRLDFTPELVQEWQGYGFNYEEIHDGINIGMRVTDADFCTWLRDEVKADSEGILNYGDVEQLRNEYQQYLTFAQIVQPTNSKVL